MNKAEKIAVEKYPHGIFDGELGDSLRAACAFGYYRAERDTIERACNWLFAHLPILVDYYNEDIHTNADRSEFIKLFRTQMEEEQ